MSTRDVDGYWPVKALAEKLGESEKQMTNWASQTRNNGFPFGRKVGRYWLYDIEEVKEWLFLYKRATNNMKRGEHLNGEGK